MDGIQERVDNMVVGILQSAVMGGPKKDLPEFAPEEEPKKEEPLPEGV